MTGLFTFEFTSVSHLLGMRSPLAIFWRVVSVVIDAINTMSCGTFSHVCKKIFKFLPPLAHFDAATAVMPIRLIVCFFASLPHAKPNLISRRPVAVYGTKTVTMDNWRLTPITAARARITSSQVAASYNGTAAAIARAQPSGAAVLVTSCFFQNCQHTKTLAGEINLMHGVLPW